jgi:hypothetical protein
MARRLIKAAPFWMTDTDESVLCEVCRWLLGLSPEFHNKGTDHVMTQWDKCLNSQGKCVKMVQICL